MEMHGNIPYVLVGINGFGKRWFVIDCGASSSVIDSTLAEKMNLTIVGGKLLRGAGKGTFKARFINKVAYKIGRLTFKTDSSYCLN